MNKSNRTGMNNSELLCCLLFVVSFVSMVDLRLLIHHFIILSATYLHRYRYSRLTTGTQCKPPYGATAHLCFCVNNPGIPPLFGDIISYITYFEKERKVALPC